MGQLLRRMVANAIDTGVTRVKNMSEVAFQHDRTEGADVAVVGCIAVAAFPGLVP